MTKKYNEDLGRPFTVHNENRPWGYYSLFSDNEPSTTKILYVKKGEMLSMQYHFLRSQLYAIMDDGFIIDYSTKPMPVKIIQELDDDKRSEMLEDFLKHHLIKVKCGEGKLFGFRELVAHRATYEGDRDFGRILDVAYGTNLEFDINRIKDKYNRK